MTCTRCNSSGFLNIHQLPQEEFVFTIESVQEWMLAHPDSDVQVCDCCGNGKVWYGEPGEHFRGGDHSGHNGPYAYNGGLPECA